MTELGLDIDEDILLRLEVKDLIRCKGVCKSWYSLISSGCFVKSQLNNNVRKKVDNNEIGDTRITALTCTSMCVGCCWTHRRHECQVVGSSNGLVCISRHNKDFLVVNPSTREVKEVRNAPEAYCVSGFGFDSSIDDYKVVIGFRNEHSKSYVFEVLTLKSNVWRSVYVELGYDDMFGNGILCNGAIHWASYQNNKKVIVSFHLSKEVFKEIPQPKLRRSDWKLGTMKDCLCIFASPNINCKKNEDIEIWVMRKYKVQQSWERKLPPPGYDTHKMIMHYFPQIDFFNRHVHIWLSEGSCAPVLVRSIEHSEDELHHRNAHIRLSMNSECNYNYDHHVFVKSLVSPHGSGSSNEERVKRKRPNVISPDGDGKSMKSRRESFASHNSDGGRAKSKRQSHISSDFDDGGRGVERTRRERERDSLVFHSSDGGRTKSKRQSHISSDSNDDGRRMERKRRERESESESLVFHSSDERRAKRKKAKPRIFLFQ
nr:putative F-box domain-containing protein [Tanacetum cinerariifolium]